MSVNVRAGYGLPSALFPVSRAAVVKTVRRVLPLAVVFLDPAQHVVDGIAAAPVVDDINDDGREGANDEGKGGDIEGG